MHNDLGAIPMGHHPYAQTPLRTDHEIDGEEQTPPETDCLANRSTLKTNAVRGVVTSRVD